MKSSLRYYLEHYLGRSRAFVLRRIAVVSDQEQTWQKVVGPDGLFSADRTRLHEGDAFRLRLPNGEQTAARLLLELADKDFVASADWLDGGIFRIALETLAGQPEIWLWALSWTLAEREVERLASPLFDAVDQRLRRTRGTAYGDVAT